MNSPGSSAKITRYKLLPARLSLAAFGSRVGSHVRQLTRLIDGLLVTGDNAPHTDGSWDDHGIQVGLVSKWGMIYMGPSSCHDHCFFDVAFSFKWLSGSQL